MAYDMCFVLFRNNKATAENRQPQYRGKATVGGAEYKLSAWVKETEKAGKFLAGKIEAADAGERGQPAAEREPEPEQEETELL